MGKKYAGYDSAGDIVAYFDSEESPAPPSATVIAITDAQWQACLSDPGYTVVKGALVAPAAPTPTELLLEAQTAQIELLAQDYLTAIATDVGFTTAAGVTKIYQADPDSRRILTETVAGYTASGSVPAGFWWKSTDNTKVSFTLADLQGLSDAMLAQGWAAFQNLDAKKADVEAATTVADVQAIAW